MGCISAPKSPLARPAYRAQAAPLYLAPALKGIPDVQNLRARRKLDR